jgi:hypothetical protein
MPAYCMNAPKLRSACGLAISYKEGQNFVMAVEIEF